MWYFIITVAIILAAFSVWSGIEYRKQKKANGKDKDKPPFRSEKDLDEYGKPLQDKDYNPVDFGDTE